VCKDGTKSKKIDNFSILADKCKEQVTEFSQDAKPPNVDSVGNNGKVRRCTLAGILD
jgi:hypothetical protein